MSRKQRRANEADYIINLATRAPEPPDWWIYKHIPGQTKMTASSEKLLAVTVAWNISWAREMKAQGEKD